MHGVWVCRSAGECAISALSPAPGLLWPPQALLERQLAGCKQQLEVVQWEHDYIKDQLTTTEVCGSSSSSSAIGVCSRGDTAAFAGRQVAGGETRVMLVRVPRRPAGGVHSLPCRPFLPENPLCSPQVSMARVYNWDVQQRRAGAAS